MGDRWGKNFSVGTEAHPKFNLIGVEGNQDSGDQVAVARKQNKGEFNEKENAHQEDSFPGQGTSI